MNDRSALWQLLDKTTRQFRHRGLWRLGTRSGLGRNSARISRPLKGKVQMQLIRLRWTSGGHCVARRLAWRPPGPRSGPRCSSAPYPCFFPGPRGSKQVPTEQAGRASGLALPAPWMLETRVPVPSAPLSSASPWPSLQTSSLTAPFRTTCHAPSPCFGSVHQPPSSTL